MWKRVGELFDSRSGKGNAFWRWFPWAWLILGYCVTMGILWKFGRPYIDSDMSSELILANLLNREGGLLSTNWWYSTELRVFCVQLFYRVGLLLFPEDWYSARIFGQALWMALLIISYFYLANGLKLKNRGVWGAAALTCPFGTWYFWYGHFGGYYIPHIIWILMSFGAILHLVQSNIYKEKAVHGALLIVACGFSGLNGIKGLMAFFVPMVLSSLVLLWMEWNANPKRFPDGEIKLTIAAVAALVVAGAGYLVNSKILSQGHHFENYNDQSWSTLRLDLLVQKWGDFFSLFGYPADSFLGGDTAIFSLNGILGAFGLMVAGAIIISLVRLLIRWKELPLLARIAPVLLAVTGLVQGIVFSSTGNPSSNNASYWLPVVPLVFPVLQLELETEPFRLPFARRLSALALCICFIFTSIGTVNRFFREGIRAVPQLEPICQWLMEEGYKQGYATFWNGNVLTEWSNGEIEMWVVDDFKELNIRQWLQSTSHAQPPEGEVFLLSTLGELEQMGLDSILNSPSVAFIEEGTWDPYVVLAYQSVEEMQAEIQQVLQLAGS